MSAAPAAAPPVESILLQSQQLQPQLLSSSTRFVPPIMQARKSFRGVLHKQDTRDTFIQGWKRRFFYLRRGRLYYYKHEGDDAPVSFIPLRSAMAIRPSAATKHAISIVMPHREFVLRAGSQQQVLNTQIRTPIHMITDQHSRTCMPHSHFQMLLHAHVSLFLASILISVL